MRSLKLPTDICGSERTPGWFASMDGTSASIKDDTGSFTITSVLGLTTDNDGCLWLRLQDLTILRYCNGRSNTLPKMRILI